MADYSRPMGIFLLIVHSVFLRNVFGVTLSPCYSRNITMVVDGEADNTFSCSDLGSGLPVQWTVVYKSTEYSAGYCPPVRERKNCRLGPLGDAFIPTRVSDTQSQLVVDSTKLTSTSSFRGLSCKDSDGSSNSCRIDVVVPAQGTCLMQIGTGSSRFQLNGSCTLQPGAKSSRNIFGCQWKGEGLKESRQALVSLSEKTYQTGCILAGEPLPVATGWYTYYVKLIPGLKSVNAGTINIMRPAAPAVTDCRGSDFVPEQTTVSCTCSTDTIGQPPGRLQWVKEGKNSAITVGDYGIKSLTVSETLLRGDHHSSVFRCNVEWTEDIPGAVVKFNVGYPPTQVLFELNRHQRNLIVNEFQVVGFSCRNSNGRPEPTLSLVKDDNSSVLLSSSALTLSHKVVVRCEDSGWYLCTADNGMGPTFSGPLRLLLVQCSPRGKYDVGEMNFNDEPVSTTFEVTAYPRPTHITFSYLGPLLNGTGEPSEVNVSLIQLTGHCLAKSGTVCQSTCTVTVTNVTSRTAAGFYHMTVGNSRGSGQFRFQVLYKAPATFTPANTGKDETNLGLVAGGIIAAIVVIAFVIFVIITIMKRMKEDVNEHHLLREHGDPAWYGEYIEPVAQLPAKGDRRSVHAVTPDYEDIEVSGI